jgi:hypothetical protein
VEDQVSEIINPYIIALLFYRLGLKRNWKIKKHLYQSRDAFVIRDLMERVPEFNRDETIPNRVV